MRCPPTRGDIHLGEDVADMAIDGLLAQRQLAGDRLVGLAAGDQPQDLKLALSESAGAGRRTFVAGMLETGADRIDSGKVGLCAQSFEDLARVLKLEPCPLDVAQRDAGTRQQHSQTRRDIRRPELLPDSERTPDWNEDRVRVALSELDRSASMPGDSGQHLGVQV